MHREIRLLAWVVTATTALQLWLAHRYFGFLTGDDVEVLAEAFHAAVGFDYRPWNIRNLFIPDWIVAPVIILASKAGLHDPRRLIEAATLPFIAGNAAAIACVHRLTVRWTSDRTTADVASGLFALHWIPLAFGSTVYPRNVAMVCIVLAALLVTTSREIASNVAAGALVGVAFADRFSEIIFLAPLLLLAARAEGTARMRVARVIAVIVGTAASIALLVGAYDARTYGAPFTSLRNFAELTLIHPDFASATKFQPPAWYLANSAKWLAWTMLPLFWYARRSAAAKHAAVFIVVPLLALSAVRHKELRYLQAAIPFVAIAAAIGFRSLWQSGHRRWAAGLLAASLAWNLAGVRVLAKKSMPSVMAARALATDPAVRTVAMSQLWACGDRIFLGDRRGAIDIATPPRDLANGIRFADAMIIYETDLDDPRVSDAIHEGGFVPVSTLRDGPSRAVVVFRRR